MVHDFRPVVVNAIRSGANRRGALAALLGVIPLVTSGTEQVAARSQRQGQRSAKSERKKKKKAIAGPAGAQGPTGAQGPAGPKAITSALANYTSECSIDAGAFSSCPATCPPGELPVSGGFEIVDEGLQLFKSVMTDNGWTVSVKNTHALPRLLRATVYCIPT